MYPELDSHSKTVSRQTNIALTRKEANLGIDTYPNIDSRRIGSSYTILDMQSENHIQPKINKKQMRDSITKDVNTVIDTISKTNTKQLTTTTSNRKDFNPEIDIRSKTNTRLSIRKDVNAEFNIGSKSNSITESFFTLSDMQSELDSHKKTNTTKVMPESVNSIAESIINSVLKLVEQYEKDKEEQTRERQPDTFTIYSQPFSYPSLQRSPSLEDFANEFLNSIFQDAVKRLAEKDETVEEDIESKAIAAKLFPKTFAAMSERSSVYNKAISFINSLLNESRNRTDNLKLLGVERFQNYTSVHNFKVKDGLEIVARCISKWSFNPHWYFKIIYNGRIVTESHSYFYTVRWSVPTLSYPVAQVTADIYFTVEVFPKSPPPVHIEVYYRLETDRSNRCALRTQFMEKWLCTVIKRKLLTFQKFKF